MSNNQSINSNWNVAQIIAFKFLFAFFLIYIFPFPLYYIPKSNVIFQYYYDLWTSMNFWVGENILNIGYEYSEKSTGSGDKTYSYVSLFFRSCLAVISVIIWIIVDKNRKDYRILYKWFIIFIRYYLAFMMLSYGFAKVFVTQFPAPWLIRYVEIYGNFSPMGVVWNFMGHSAAYTMFSGWGEVIGGVLLLIRRTSVLGALVTIGVMTNVVMLNFSYDIPVKLFSSTLLLMAFIIFLSDWKRILNLFILNRASEKVDQSLPISNPKLKIAAIVIKVILVTYVAYNDIEGSYSYKKSNTEKPLMYGLYNVKTFVVNNDTLPPLVTDTIRWRNLAIDKRNYIGIRMMDDERVKGRQKTDTTKNEITIFPRTKSADSLVLQYKEFLSDSLLILNGVRGEDSVFLELEKMNVDNFRVKRGFHWINERPYNW